MAGSGKTLEPTWVKFFEDLRRRSGWGAVFGMAQMDQTELGDKARVFLKEEYRCEYLVGGGRVLDPSRPMPLTVQRPEPPINPPSTMNPLFLTETQYEEAKVKAGTGGKGRTSVPKVKVKIDGVSYFVTQAVADVLRGKGLDESFQP